MSREQAYINPPAPREPQCPARLDVGGGVVFECLRDTGHEYEHRAFGRDTTGRGQYEITWDAPVFPAPQAERKD